MKKTYISPEALTVSLTMCNIVAQSPAATPNGDVTFDPDGEIDGAFVGTKGYKNVWDTEW